MLAERELLESVTFLIVTEADEASDDSKVNEGITVCDDANFYKMSRVHSLLYHVVDPILTQNLYSRLVSNYLLLNVV